MCDFRVKNAAVLREFFLARPVKRSPRGGASCDIAILDLDSDDSFVLIIENKLFTHNHSRQLVHYLERVEDRYRSARVREYVYLTLNGDNPRKMAPESEHVYARWLRMSWLEDVFQLLEALGARERDKDTLGQLMTLPI